MKKSELLRALQTEIRRHDFSTFLTEELANDVLPALINKLSTNRS
jgi:hypothetical protein